MPHEVGEDYNNKPTGNTALTPATAAIPGLPPTEVTRLISPDAPAIIRRDPKTGWLAVVWNRNSNRIENLYSRRVPASAQSATNRLLHF